MPLSHEIIDQSARHFDAAWSRLAAATTPDDARYATTDALGAIYKLMEARVQEVGKPAFLAAIASGGPLELLAAIRWARNGDVHTTTAVAGFADVFGAYFTAMWGTLVWQRTIPLPAKHGEREAYERTLADQDVLATLREAMDALITQCRG